MGNWAFVAPPGWPNFPPEWTPPTGWVPDPSWPPAPENWRFWLWVDDAPSSAVSGAGATVVPTAGTSVLPGRAPKPSGFFARRRDERAVRAVAQQDFEALGLAAAKGEPGAIDRLSAELSAARSQYRPRQFEQRLLQILRFAAHEVLADDVLTSREETHLVNLLDALGVTIDLLAQRDADLYESLMIARINDGRLPNVDPGSALLKRGEVAHGLYTAALMKEVVRREYRGGSSGVSIPIGMGMRYRTSRTRGRSVVVGTDLVPADTGQLLITSQRALFLGSKKTLEFRFDRLVGIQQYTDGIRLNVSNRQTASLIRIPKQSHPSIAAALIAYGASA